jgi:hypothetical protein
MEKIIVWAYNLYKTVKQWYYKADTVSYYMITKEGEKLPLFYPCTESVSGFLTVYNKNGNYKYKFTNNFIIEDLQIPSYTWIGLQVRMHNKSHILKVHDYLVSPNILFTYSMKLWLCHKLKVEPTTDMDICLIDENVNIRTIKNTIKLYKNNYIEQEQT